MQGFTLHNIAHIFRKLREGAACQVLLGLQRGQAIMVADGVVCGLASPQNGHESRDHFR